MPTFLLSMRRVTVLIPWRTTLGRLVTSSFLPAARASARARSLVFLASFDSGRYLFSREKVWAAETETLFFRSDLVQKGLESVYRLTEPVRINASWHLCEMLITCNSDPTLGGQNIPVCLSRVDLNWLTGGGMRRRLSSTAFWRCRRTYLGHLTKRVRSRFGWMSPPANNHSTSYLHSKSFQFEEKKL